MKKLAKSFLLLLLLTSTTGIFSQNGKPEKNMQNEFKIFLKAHVDVVKDKYKAANEAYFNATISGKKEDYDKASKLQIELQNIYSNKADFKKVKEFHESGKITEPLLKRQLEMLYNSYLGKQVDTAKLAKVTILANEIEMMFSTFRATIKGKDATDNEIEDILRKSTNTADVKEAWIESKKIGPIVAEKLKQLVKMRNEMAKELGFSNYHEMSLKLDEQDPQEIEKLFDELDLLTKDAFAKEKEVVDDYFAKRFKIKKEELRPWHYQNRFFQEGPEIYEVDFDKYYQNENTVDLATRYYVSQGLPVAQILVKSDLYEKPGKYQHAYCTNIDANKDVRVVCNMKNNTYWMNTILHELGHAVYDYNINDSVPFLLHQAAHTFTTEAIAQIYGRFSQSAQWLYDMQLISEQEKNKINNQAYQSLRLQMLVFSRWSQVMYRFEKAMYANPDQDLNKLWWDLVEKYQMLKRPEGRNEPDYATKIHIATVPCYYHNYLLGELLASQFLAYVAKNIYHTDDLNAVSFANKPEVGKYFIEKVFKPGRIYFWNDMIEKATGEKLTAKYYAKQFVK